MQKETALTAAQHSPEIEGRQVPGLEGTVSMELTKINK